MEYKRIREILKTKVVGIAGAGGLGSNAAIALARSGIGTLVITDFDIIDMSNLNRQYYFFHQIGKKKVLALEESIKMVNSDIKVVSYAIKLESHHIIDIYKDCDVIIEAFDLPEMKEMIINTVLDKFPETPLIVGSGMAGYGGNNLITTVQSDNLYICGDQISEVSDNNPPLAPRVGIVSMMQANQALEILLK